MRQLLYHHDLVRKNLIAILGLVLCFYFSYHLIQGERSYLRYISLKQNILSLDNQYNNLRQERSTLETRVSMLRSSSIDKDLLEERARVVLGYRNKGEKDILIKK